MSIHMLVPARRLAAFLAAALCLVAALVAVSSAGGRADASPHPVRAGAGRHSGGEFVGYYLTSTGTKVWCLSPRRATPRSVTLRTVRRYPGASPSAGAALAYALRVWGNPHSRDAAAVESQVVNTLAGNRADVARRARGLSTAVRRLTAAHVALARAMRGPYRVGLSAPRAPLPGTTARGTVLVRSATGRPVAGVRVELRSSRTVRVAAAVRTGRAGTAAFDYTAVDVGAGRLTATVRGLPGVELRISDPRAGEQRMASGAGSAAATGSVSFRAAAGGFGHHYACSSECAGRPVVSLVACAPASRAASRIVYRAGTATVVRSFAAATRRRCGTVSLRVPDGTVVTAAWQYATTHGWSTPLPAGGGFTVDCPPAPAVTVTMSQDCTTARVTGTARPSRLPTSLTITGSRRATVPAAAGHAATWTTAAPCGSHLTVRFRSSVRRAGGGWNVGPVATVTTP